MKKRWICTLLGLSLLLQGCSLELQTSREDDVAIQKQNELASHSPYEPYGELIEYKLAKLTGLNNMPSGHTYENNAVTRYLKEKLNIQNINIIEAKDQEYENSIDMYISSKDLPDIMIVQDYDDLQYLVENDMIEDLTTAYKECTTQRIKDIYESYGDTLMDLVTFDDKIMALPETNISNGPNLIWLRKDWMDKLGLQEPKSLSDVEHIVKEFITKNPGQNEGQTTGLILSTDIVGESAYSSEYLLDPIFAYYGAYPKQWYKDKNNNLVYGSITKQAKQALEHIHELYKEGIIDKDFILRTTNNIVDEIVEGRCGSFFGPWWASNNPLVDALKQDENASWKCYLLPTEENGETIYYSQAPSTKYIVVRKGYEYPEIIFKMISVQFDYLRYTDTSANEINNYERNNVDPTSRPLSINVDYANALIQSHQNILDVIQSKKTIDEVPILDGAYAKACLDYLDTQTNSTAEDWAAYASRIEAPSLFNTNNVIEKRSLFYGKTKTMNKTWWKLKQMENEAYIEFIMGERDLDEFDDFVKEWKSQGGQDIIQEINAQV